MEIPMQNCGGIDQRRPSQEILLAHLPQGVFTREIPEQ